MSLYTQSGGDPHEFTPSASDTADVVDAQVVVLNGGHYDEYMERAAQRSRGTVIDAYDLLTTGTEPSDSPHPAGDDPTGAGQPVDSHGQDSHENEHVFYDLAVVAAVAKNVGAALAAADEANAPAYRANAQRFVDEIDTLRASLAMIRQRHDGTRVAQVEPLAGYLLTEAGLVDVAPAGFTTAVEEGQSPSAADRAAMQDLLTSHTAKVLVYNTQAADPATNALLGVAKGASVPVVNFTETLPEGVTGYVAWQRAQIAALAAALDAAGPRS
ncbi:zinc ABC transporter substrate-binding protein [Gordonia sinesedis]